MTHFTSRQGRKIVLLDIVLNYLLVVNLSVWLKLFLRFADEHIYAGKFEMRTADSRFYS